jgi:Protein of unknown function (DUF3738)
MTSCMVLRLIFGKRLLLTAAGMAAATAPIIVGVLNTPQIRAQPQAARPAFEVAPIRPDPGPPSPIQITPGSLRGSVPISAFIRSAYGVHDYQVSGGPGWLETDRYRMEAKAEGVASQDRIKEMLQTLLQDRLNIHRRPLRRPLDLS